MLKPVPDVLPLYTSPCMGPESLQSEYIGSEEEMEDGQWICVPLPEETPPATVPAPAVSPLGHAESVVGPLRSDGWQEASGSGVNSMLVPAVPAVSPPGRAESVAGLLHSDDWQEASGSGVNFPRRSARETAGTHSNLHRLPRAVGTSANGAVTSFFGHSEGMTIVFRPWI